MPWDPIKARAPRSGRLVHRNNDPALILPGQSPHDGDTGDLAVPARHSLRTRIQDILWDMGVDAFPNMHVVAKADAKDLKPETV